MGISVADNFSYLGGKPLDGRIQYATLAAMKAMADATLYEGCEAYCVATDKYYKWKSSNTVDADTGKWREVESGGGQTYNDFTGATASTAGAHGLVPAPSAGDEGKVLFGNGAWGALPSVDLSVLSNEAFILSTTEKAVGQTSDGYLIYQKYIPITRKRANWVQQYSATITITASEYNISNLGKLMCAYAFCDGWDSANGKSGVFHCGANMSPSSTDITIALLDSMGVYAVMLRYTKTTDSPLPSDVKFAGVTSSGEVIYERKITISNDISMSANSWTTIYSASWLTNARMVDFTFRRDGNTIFPCEMELKHSANQLNVCVPYNRTFYTDGYVILRYTLAS